MTLDDVLGFLKYHTVGPDMTPEQRTAMWDKAMREGQADNRLVYPNPFGDQHNVKPDNPAMRAPVASPVASPVPTPAAIPAQEPADTWQSAEKVQKNDAGEFRAMINGQWIPAAKAQKNEAGEFRVMLAESPSMDTMNAVKTFGALAVPGAPAMKLMNAIGEGAYSAGGKITDITGSPAAGLATNVALQSLPMVAGGSMAKIASSSLESGAKRLMQSAIKPTAGQLERGQGQEAVDTALNEGIAVSKGGMEKLRRLIEPIDTSIRKKLEPSTASAALSEFSPAFAAARKGARYSPPQESGAISKTLSDFEDKFYPGGGQLPVQDIQKIKQAYYRALGPESYGILTSGERTGMKAVALGAKQAVANAVPGVAAENAQLGPLLNALNVIERRVELAPNRDIGGLVWLAHNLKTGILMLMGRDPYTKSLMARGLYSGSEQIPATAARLGIAGAETMQGQQP